MRWGGGRGVRRQILGVPSGRTREEPVDFSDRAAIYVLFTEFELVYIGQAGRGKDSNLGSRLAQHQRDHLAERWDRFSWFAIEGGRGTLGRVTVLNQLEAVLIASAEPRLNRSAGNWHGAEQYRQVNANNPQ